MRCSVLFACIGYGMWPGSCVHRMARSPLPPPRTFAVVGGVLQFLSQRAAQILVGLAPASSSLTSRGSGTYYCLRVRFITFYMHHASIIETIN